MVTEMRMISWMSGYVRVHRIRNEVIRDAIRDIIKVAPNEDNMMETRLRCSIM